MKLDSTANMCPSLYYLFKLPNSLRLCLDHSGLLMQPVKCLQENEYVVRNILMKNASSFELVHILPDWPSRGLPVFTKGKTSLLLVISNIIIVT